MRERERLCLCVHLTSSFTFLPYSLGLESIEIPPVQLRYKGGGGLCQSPRYTREGVRGISLHAPSRMCAKMQVNGTDASDGHRIFFDHNARVWVRALVPTYWSKVKQAKTVPRILQNKTEVVLCRAPNTVLFCCQPQRRHVEIPARDYRESNQSRMLLRTNK